MKPKEVLFMFGIFLLVFGSLFLIPDNPKSKQMLAEGSSVQWQQVTDDPDLKLTISWLGLPGYMAGKEGSWIETNLEQQFNMDLKPVFMDHNAYQRRRPLLFADGDIPDVMWSSTSSLVRVNVRNAFVMELPYDLICQYAPTYVKLLNENCKEAWLQTRVGGKNYGLPTFFLSAKRSNLSGWRGDWLRKVGFDRAPDTIDEMEEALRRFRHNDPDGNEKKDTYGYCPDIRSWAVAYLQIYPAYDILAFDFMQRDGKIVWGGTQPEAKEVLTRLRKWYDEGLIDPDYILSGSSDGGMNKFLNGKTGFLPLTSYADPANPNSTSAKLKALNGPDAELWYGKPLIARSGRRRCRSWGAAGHNIQFGRHLEDEPKKVIRVLKMIEAITTSEHLLLEANHGKKGLHWEWTDEEGVFLLPPYADNKAKRERELLRDGVQGSFFYYMTGIMPLYPAYLSRARQEFDRTYTSSDWGFQNAIGKSGILPSAGRYLKPLTDYQQKAYAEIITGEANLESFDDFVASFMQRGGTQLVEEANQIHEETQKMYSQIDAAMAGRVAQ